AFITVVANNFGPVSKDETLKDFVVDSGETYLTIASKLKEQNLIKSEVFYKLYIKMTNPKPLQACTYKLSESYDLVKLIQELQKDCLFNPDNVRITIPENYTLEKLADLIASKTNNTREELFKVWDNKDFVRTLIDKYWFLTDVV